MEDVSFVFPDNQGSIAAAPVLRLAALFPAEEALEEELLDYMLLQLIFLLWIVKKVNQPRVVNYVFLGRKLERYPRHC